MMMDDIYLGDANQLIKQIPDKSIDCIMTDPPYKFENNGVGSGILKDRLGKENCYVNLIKNSNLSDSFDLRILNEFVRVMKKINIFLWCNKEQIYDYLTYFVYDRNCLWDMIILYKSCPVPFTNGHFLKDKEYCLYFRERGVTMKTREYDLLHTVYMVDTYERQQSKKLYLHPTIKPENVISNLLKAACNEGDVILDPFSGSGTTAVCAKKLNMHYIGFEINEKFYKASKDRINGISISDREAMDNGQMKLF